MGLQIMSGLGDWKVKRDGQRGARCQQVMKQIVVRCFMGNIGVNRRNQFRDTQIRNMMFAEAESWFETRPDFYFTPCKRVLAVLIKHSKANIAQVGIKMLAKVLLKEEAHRRVVVDNAFMWDIREDLSSRVLKPPRGKAVDKQIKDAILHFVTTRYPTTNRAHDDSGKADKWRDLARLLEGTGQAI